jgi:hypothetical protein
MKSLDLKQMEQLNGGEMSGNQWGCNAAMSVVAGIWGTAFGLVTMGAGFAVGLGMSLFGSWVCSNVE